MERRALSCLEHEDVVNCSFTGSLAIELDSGVESHSDSSSHSCAGLCQKDYEGDGTGPAGVDAVTVSRGKRLRARTCAFRASSSRFRGGALVRSEWIKRLAAAATSSTALLKASSFARDGRVAPLSFRTNWTAAARISSSLAGGSMFARDLIFLHIAGLLEGSHARSDAGRCISRNGAPHSGVAAVGLGFYTAVPMLRTVGITLQQVQWRAMEAQRQVRCQDVFQCVVGWGR